MTQGEMDALSKAWAHAAKLDTEYQALRAEFQRLRDVADVADKLAVQAYRAASVAKAAASQAKQAHRSLYTSRIR
jgi:hypothetical protein